MSAKIASKGFFPGRLRIFLVFSVLAACQNASILWAQNVPVVTDQVNVTLGDNFLTQSSLGLNNNGDVYFSSGAFFSLFHWNAATGARTRLLQINDPIPGFAGSVLRGVAAPTHVLPNGHAAMVNAWSAPGARDPSGIFIYDGSRFLPVVLSGDAIPGSADQVFTTFYDLRMNANDQVAFTAQFDPPEEDLWGVFLGSTAGPPVKIATESELSDAVGFGVGNNVMVLGIDNSGNISLLCSDGYTYAIVVASSTGIRNVIRSGDAAPGTAGSFNLSSSRGNYALNAGGDLAFFSMVRYNAGVFGAIFVLRASGTIQKLVMLGESTGTTLGGTYNSFSFRGFNDNGQVLFNAGLSGSSATVNALFLKTLDAAPQVLCYNNQLIQGGPLAFNGVFTAALGSSGKAAVVAALKNGSSSRGLFLLSASEAPQIIALEGTATSLGGTYAQIGNTRINSSNQVVFRSDILGLNRNGLYLWTPVSGIRPVVSTIETIPASANRALVDSVPSAGDHELVFWGYKGEGRDAIFTKSLRSGDETIRRIIGEGDAAPGGGVVTFINRPAINDQEELVVFSSVIGGPVYPADALWFSRPGSGLRKLVMTGDAAPGAGAGTIGTVTGQPRINNSGQVAFIGTVTGGSNSGGIFLMSSDGTIQAIARLGDSSPAGGTFQSFVAPIWLNDAGQVSFRAISQTNTGPVDGLFWGTTTSAPTKFVAQGDLLPNQDSVNRILGCSKLNSAGQVACCLDASTNGIYLFGPGAAPKAIALEGDDSSVPNSGILVEFKIGPDTPLEINNSGQIAFWAVYQTTGGLGGYGTGIFVGSATSSPEARIYTGKVLPGGGSYFYSLPQSGYFALADTGDLAINVLHLSDAPDLSRYVVAKPSGELLPFAAVGEAATGTSSNFGRLGTVAVNSTGSFFMTANLIEGQTKQGIFRFDTVSNLPPGKASLVSPSGRITTHTPAYVWNATASATYYQLWVHDSNASDFSVWYTSAQAGCASGTGTCSITPSLSLPSGAVQWWIQTWNTYGYGPWSDALSFEVTAGGVPPKAILVSPDGAIAIATPAFIWNAVAEATWYQLWVNDSDGSGKIVSWYTSAQAGCASGTGTCSVAPGIVLASGAAAWWIQTWNSSGDGPWSDGMSFVVASGTLPGKATLVSPTGNVATATPTYTWNAVANSTWYQLWVNDSTNASGKVLLWYTSAQAGCASGTGTCSVTPSNPLAAGAAEWWIQTWNPTGYGPWSDVMRFTVTAAGFPNPPR